MQIIKYSIQQRRQSNATFMSWREQILLFCFGLYLWLIYFFFYRTRLVIIFYVCRLPVLRMLPSVSTLDALRLFHIIFFSSYLQIAFANWDLQLTGKIWVFTWYAFKVCVFPDLTLAIETARQPDKCDKAKVRLHFWNLLYQYYSDVTPCLENERFRGRFCFRFMVVFFLFPQLV